MDRLPVKHGWLIGVAFLAFLWIFMSLTFDSCKSNISEDDEVVEINYDDPNYWAQFWTEKTKTDPETGITEYWQYYKGDLYLYRKTDRYGRVLDVLNYYELNPEYFKEKYPEFKGKPRSGK